MRTGRSPSRAGRGRERRARARGAPDRIPRHGVLERAPAPRDQTTARSSPDVPPAHIWVRAGLCWLRTVKPLVLSFNLSGYARTQQRRERATAGAVVLERV